VYRSLSPEYFVKWAVSALVSSRVNFFKEYISYIQYHTYVSYIHTEGNVRTYTAQITVTNPKYILQTYEINISMQTECIHIYPALPRAITHSKLRVSLLIKQPSIV
jgi:hypothetical protein